MTFVFKDNIHMWIPAISGPCLGASLASVNKASTGPQGDINLRGVSENIKNHLWRLYFILDLFVILVVLQWKENPGKSFYPINLTEHNCSVTNRNASFLTLHLNGCSEQPFSIEVHTLNANPYIILIASVRLIKGKSDIYSWEQRLIHLEMFSIFVIVDVVFQFLHGLVFSTAMMDDGSCTHGRHESPPLTIQNLTFCEPTRGPIIYMDADGYPGDPPLWYCSDYRINPNFQ